MRTTTTILGGSLAGIYALVPVFFTGLLSTSLAITTAHAENEPPAMQYGSSDEVPTLVITPNRVARDPKTIGSAYSVLDAEDIEAQKIHSVGEALRGVPGLTVVQTGSRGAVSSVFIRGAESDQVLVLLNGVRLNESTTGGFDFADLSVDNIDRIEVLRGPQGVLYGSEAVGGVIQIFTKEPVDGPHLSAGVEGGSYGTHREQVRAGYGSEKISSSTSISWEQTDGFSVAAANRGNSERDGFELFNLNSRHVVRPVEEVEVHAGLSYLKSHVDLDGFDFESGPVDDPDFTQSRDRLVLDSGIAGDVLDWLRPSVAVSYVDEDLEGRDPSDEFNRFDIDSSHLSVQSQAQLEQSDQAYLTLGHTYEQRKGENRGSFDEQRDVNAFFLEQGATVKELYLSAGARHEFDSDFGEETTYRLTAALPIERSASRLHASYGTGFKAPSFNELAFPNFGNPDLEAETSWGYDVGVEQAFGEVVTGDLTFFHSKYDNLIGFDTDTFIAENIAEARALGFEFALHIDPSTVWDVDLSYTYTDSENKETGRILARRPRHQASALLRVRPLEQIESTLRMLLVNSRRDSDGEKMDNYATLDATVRYLHSEHIKPYLRLVNVFDESYEELPGYSTPGFSVYAGLDVSLF